MSIYTINNGLLSEGKSTLSVVGNAQDNTLEQWFDSEGFLHLVLDGIHYTSNSNSDYYDPSLAGLTADNLQGINFLGGEGEDTLLVGNQTLNSTFVLQGDELVELNGEISGSKLTVNAQNINFTGYFSGSDLVLQSENETTVSGRISAVAGDLGGTIHLLGEKVRLLEAQINASGDNGGGTILIGGDYQGQGEIPTAAWTFVDEETRIDADALTQGNGGKIIVWADGTTEFSGKLSAKGGRFGGDGGFAEISGKEFLVYQGAVDVSAPQGNQGTVLFDPKNITIATGGTDLIATNDQFLENPAASVTFAPSSVVTALNGADVTLQANTDITVTNAIDASGNAGNGNLTLQAGRNVTLNANLTVKGLFTANTDDSSADGSNRDAGAAILTVASGTIVNATNGISLRSDYGSIVHSGSLSTPNNVTLRTDTMDLGSGLLNAGGTANLRVTSGGISINLGSTAGATAGSLNLSQAELDTITANTLRLTSANGIAITNAITINPAKVPTLNLESNNAGSITQTNSLQVQNLEINAGSKNVTLTNAGNEFTSLLNSSGGNFTLTDPTSLILGNVSATGTLNITIDSDNNTTGATLQISGPVSGATINFSGGTDNNDTVIGSNIANTWTITGSNTGSLGTASLTNFVNFTGGTSTDSFSLTNAGSLTGSLEGGTGNDTLTGDADGNSFSITGANSGTLTGKTSGWSNIENLSGGAGVDTFVFSGGSLSGTIQNLGSGDILSGNGTITGALTVGSGATVSPGNSPGILNTGDITFTSGSTLTMEVNGATPGTQHDQLNLKLPMPRRQAGWFQSREGLD